MSDRRRNLFVLLAVLGLIAASLAVITTKETKLGLDLQGGVDAEDAERQVGTTAQMYFYDWEPNILDEDCKTNPESVNGGQQPISGLYKAVKRASKCPPEVDRNNTADGALFYAFDKKSHAPLNNGLPEENRKDLRDDLTDEGK